MKNKKIILWDFEKQMDPLIKVKLVTIVEGDH